MKTQETISLKERNQKALKNFIMWREKKQEQEEEEDTDFSLVNILIPDQLGSRSF